MHDVSKIIDKITILTAGRKGDVQRVDARGRPFEFGGPGQEHSRAPAFVHSLGEQPYSVFRAFNSLWRGDTKLAPLEWAVSKKLEALGYGSTWRGALLIPWGADLLWKTEGHEQEVERLMTEVKQLFIYG